MSARGEASRLFKAGLILLTGLIQSVSIAGVGIATDTIAPVTFTALRVGIAALTLAGLLALLRPPFRWRARTVADIALLGLLNVAVPFLSLAVALTFISTSLAAALYQVVPVFTVILANFLLPGERLNAIRAVGTAVSVAGATILVVAGAIAPTIGPQALAGEAIILFASLVVAVGIVYARARVRGVSTLVLAAGQMFAAVAIVVPLALALEGPPALGAYPLQAWAATAVAALGTPVAGYWLFYYVVERFSASLASFTGITTPFFSAAIGVALLGEAFTLPMTFGTLLLLAGVWLVTRAY